MQSKKHFQTSNWMVRKSLVQNNMLSWVSTVSVRFKGTHHPHECDQCKLPFTIIRLGNFIWKKQIRCEPTIPFTSFIKLSRTMKSFHSWWHVNKYFDAVLTPFKKLSTWATKITCHLLSHKSHVPQIFQLACIQVPPCMVRKLFAPELRCKHF